MIDPQAFRIGIPSGRALNFWDAKIFHMPFSLGWPIPQDSRKNKLLKKKLYKKTMIDPQAFRFGIPGGQAPNFWDANFWDANSLKFIEIY